MKALLLLLLAGSAQALSVRGSNASIAASTVTITGTGSKCFSVDDPTLVVDCSAAQKKVTAGGAGGLAVTYGVTASTLTLNSGSDVISTSENTLRAYPLDVTGRASLNIFAYGDATGAGLNAASASGTKSVPTATASGDTLLTISGFGHDGSAFTSSTKIRMRLMAEEAFSASVQGTKFAWDTTASGGTTRSQKMVLTGAGFLGIGTTAPATLLDVNGAAQFGSGATKSTFTSAGSLQLAGSVTAISYSSAPVMYAGDDIGGSGFMSNKTVTTGIVFAGNDVQFKSNGSIRAGVGASLGFYGGDCTGAQILMRSASSGSAADPQMQFCNDDNTGIFRPAADTLAFTTGGTERLRIGSTGSVGIGTVSPAFKVHESSGTLYLDGTAAKIETGANTAPVIATCGTGATIVGSDIAGKVTIGTGGATACVVTFATSYTNAPVCIVQNETTGNIQRPVAVGASVTITGVMVQSDIVDYICIGRR